MPEQRYTLLLVFNSGFKRELKIDQQYLDTFLMGVDQATPGHVLKSNQLSAPQPGTDYAHGYRFTELAYYEIQPLPLPLDKVPAEPAESSQSTVRLVLRHTNSEGQQWEETFQFNVRGPSHLMDVLAAIHEDPDNLPVWVVRSGRAPAGYYPSARYENSVISCLAGDIDFTNAAREIIQ